MVTSYIQRTPVIPTVSTVRTVISPTPTTPRTWVVSDLWYLITQLWTLCNNSWVRILFHTWTFYSSTTPYTTRSII